MSLTLLSRPVSTLMRPTFFSPVEQSLGLTAQRLRENSAGMLPITDGARLVGVVTEASLATAIANGAEDSEPSQIALVAEPPIIRLYETGAEALRSFDRFQTGALIVVDDANLVVGILRASDLLDPPSVNPRPHMIGGMATPFGVYLTTGSVSTGATGLALMTTGMVLFSMLTAATLTSYGAYIGLTNLGMIQKQADLLTTFLQFGLFAASFRLLPIAGVHAAEHMVVHAIERGEPLEPNIVKRMPRVHPRCGTNLAVGSSIFLGIALNPAISSEYFRVVLALVATLLLWRRVGGWVQYWITTRPPTDKQIEMGIRTGKALLAKQAQTRFVRVSFLTRLWNSGMFHVMAGSMLVASILGVLSALFGWGLPVFG